MKQILLISAAALLMTACASTSTSSSYDDEDAAMSESTDMMETSDSSMDGGETMTEMESAPVDTGASVDCTGLSDDECMAAVMNFGQEPATASPGVTAAPVEPVETEMIDAPMVEESS